MGNIWSPSPVLLRPAFAGDGQWENSISRLFLGTSCPFSSSARSWDRGGQQRYSHPKAEIGGKKRTEGKVKDQQILLTVEATLGSQEMLGMEGS